VFVKRTMKKINNTEANSTYVYYVNGTYQEVEQSSLNVRDLSILRGFGCFDYFRTYNDQPITIHRNVKRLRSSCNLISLPFPWTDQEVTNIILETLRRNQHITSEKGIRIVVSGGISSSNVIPEGSSSLVVMVEPPLIIDKEKYINGAKVITVEMSRIYPTAKTINYITAVIAQKKAKSEGAIEAIYVSSGMIQEATTSNIFAFFGDTLVTPPDGDILPGITRELVVEEARKKFKVEFRQIPKEKLYEADEIFITSSNKRVLPIVDVDGRKIGTGKPGNNTKIIMQMFDNICYAKAKI